MPFRPSVVLAAALLLGSAPALAAQSGDSIPASPVVAHHPAQIKLWHVGVGIAGTALLSLADKDIQHYVSTHRTQGDIDLATTWQRWGGGAVPVGITVATLGAGVILGKPEVTRTGERLATSLVGVSVVGWVLKESFGRSRPSESTDPFQFKPFSSHASLPSGHTFFAFALSTTLADAIHNRVADAALYTLAAGTGVSRVVGNHHWASDVVAGALVGITVSKVVDGKWRIFGLKPPEFLSGPQGTGMRWTFDVPALRGGRTGQD